MNANDEAMPTGESPVGTMPEEVDVAVVGAGPTGITVVGMLAAYGIRTVVLDGADGPVGHSRAAVVQARTLETLEPLGVVEGMLGLGVVVPHFGVRDRDRRLLLVPFGRLPTAHPYTLMLPQDETERLLRGSLRRFGGEIFWGHQVTGVRQDPEGVDLTVGSPRGEERLRARYVVGCDGAHSSVRGAVGVPFEGATYPESFVLADVRMDWRLPDDEVQLFFSPEGLVVVAPLPGERRYRIVATVDEPPEEPSLKDVQALIDARGPRTPRPRVEEVVWSSRFRVSHKLAARYREGAVFLAGDAAHVHSPAGGQGMNTGIQDAANLAWKLALVLGGQASESLLDSYGRERRPVAQGVVATADRLTRLATMRAPLARRLRNLLIPMVGRIGRLPERLARNLAELDIVYADGWSVDGSTRLERLVPQGDGVLEDPDPAFRLLVPRGLEARAIAAVRGYPEVPVRVVPKGGLAEVAVVRPDGYVAGRGAPEEYAKLLGLLAGALGTNRQPTHV
jgi:2-polyprenyl-6-methoxyphenol hydroxylase-like FAD-dependent oxidoreductase